MNISDKLSVQGSLAIGVGVSFVGLVLLWMLRPPEGDPASLSLLNALVMVVGTSFLTVVNWYFGSSSESKTKGDAQAVMLDKLTSTGNGNGQPAPH